MFVNTLEERSVTKSIKLNKFELIGLANLAKQPKQKFTKEDKVSVSSNTGDVTVRKLKLTPSKIKALLNTHFSISIPKDYHTKVSSKDSAINFIWKSEIHDEFATLYLDTQASKELRAYHEKVRDVYKTPEDLLLAVLTSETSAGIDSIRPKVGKNVESKKSGRAKR